MGIWQFYFGNNNDIELQINFSRVCLITGGDPVTDNTSTNILIYLEIQSAEDLIESGSVAIRDLSI